MLRLSYHQAFKLSLKFTSLPSPFSTQGTSTSPWRRREDHFLLPQAFHPHPLASQKFHHLLESPSTIMTYISQHLSLCPVITVSLPVHGLCIHGSTNHGSKILENKNSRKVQKAKLGFVACKHYLYSVYTVFTTIYIVLYKSAQRRFKVYGRIQFIRKYYTSLYEELERLWIFVSVGVREPIPRCQGAAVVHRITWYSNLAVWHSVLMTSGILLCLLIYKIRTSKIVCISEGCFEPIKALVLGI